MFVPWTKKRCEESFYWLSLGLKVTLTALGATLKKEKEQDVFVYVCRIAFVLSKYNIMRGKKLAFIETFQEFKFC